MVNDVEKTVYLFNEEKDESFVLNDDLFYSYDSGNISFSKYSYAFSL